MARVLKPMLENITEGERNFTLSTDGGAEFTRLDLPAQAVHRLKAGKQDLAVIDRGIQTLKRGLAGKAAKTNKEWDENRPGVQRNTMPRRTPRPSWPQRMSSSSRRPCSEASSEMPTTSSSTGRRASGAWGR